LLPRRCRRGSMRKISAAQLAVWFTLRCPFVALSESAERAEALLGGDRGDRTAVWPGLRQSATREFEPRRSQLRHRRRVTEAAKRQFQGPRADACRAGHVSQSDRIRKNTSLFITQHRVGTRSLPRVES
jgi:hypothetical protein